MNLELVNLTCIYKYKHTYVFFNIASSWIYSQFICIHNVSIANESTGESIFLCIIYMCMSLLALLSPWLEITTISISWFIFVPSALEAVKLVSNGLHHDGNLFVVIHFVLWGSSNLPRESFTVWIGSQSQGNPWF